MKFSATTRKYNDYYYSAIVKGIMRLVFKEPFVDRKTALKHAIAEANARNFKTVH